VHVPICKRAGGDSKMCRVGQNHTYIYGVYTVILAEKTPNIRLHAVYIYGSGQPYACVQVSKGNEAVHIYIYIRFWPTLCMCASEQRKRSCAYIYIYIYIYLCIYGSGQPNTCVQVSKGNEAVHIYI